MPSTTIALLSRALLGILIFCAACSDPPNTQLLPIGSRCTSDGDCGTVPYTCALTNYPGGYCEKKCGTDGDCVMDSICYLGECRRTCAGTSECRATEGYVCRTSGATADFCDIPGP